VTAAPDSEPKLIAETLTRDDGRKAFAEHLSGGQRHRRVRMLGFAVWGGYRERRVLDDRVVVHPFQVVVGAEAEVAVGQLRRCVHPAPLVAAEGPFRVVVGDDVLTQLGADGLQEEPQVTDDRIVAQDGVAALQQVPNRQARKASADEAGQPGFHAP
jgi:hypothetical protein